MFKKLIVLLIICLLWIGNCFPYNPLAKQIGINDAGDYYTGVTVETALQEVGASIGGIPATYLKLDQTTPQDIINGQPDFLAGLRAGSTNQLSIDASGNLTTTGTGSFGNTNTFQAGDVGASMASFLATGSAIIDSGDLWLTDTAYVFFGKNPSSLCRWIVGGSIGFQISANTSDAGDFTINIPSTDGTNKISITDGSDVEQASIDSNGNAVFNGTFSAGAITGTSLTISGTFSLGLGTDLVASGSNTITTSDSFNIGSVLNVGAGSMVVLPTGAITATSVDVANGSVIFGSADDLTAQITQHASAPVLNIYTAGGALLNPRFAFRAVEGVGNYARFQGATGTTASLASANTIGQITYEITQADPNTLKGKIVFGVNTGDAATSVAEFNDAGNLSLYTNKLLFGTAGSEDTNLYRSAVNTLKTDDSFTVADTFTVGSGTFIVTPAGSITIGGTLAISGTYLVGTNTFTIKSGLIIRIQ